MKQSQAGGRFGAHRALSQQFFSRIGSIKMAHNIIVMPCAVSARTHRESWSRYRIANCETNLLFSHYTICCCCPVLGGIAIEEQFNFLLHVPGFRIILTIVVVVVDRESLIY